MLETGTQLTKVLLVEDNPVDVIEVRDALARSPETFDLDTATALAEAIRKTRGVDYSLVLLDLGLPDSAGIETLREFRAEAGDIPIVVLTANDDEELGIEALRSGAQDYLVKGRDMDLLHRAARYATERARGQRALRDATRVTIQRERVAALGTVVAGIAHEINNPLTCIRGNAELTVLALADLLQSGSVTAQQAEVLKHAADLQRSLIEGLDRIARLSRTLKRLAREPVGRRSSVDASALAKQVAELAAAEFKDEVKIEVEVVPVPRVRADEVELFQVVLNLVLNAAQAVGERGRVVVSTSAKGRSIEIRVQDDGPGIPADVQAHLFTPFFTTKAEGTGLGLSVSRRIVEDHGGSLTFTSDARGTAFLVTLPERIVD